MGQLTSGHIDLAGTILGGAMEAGGSVMGGIHAREQAGYRAAVHRNNALIADDTAAAVMRRGRAQVQERAIEGAQTIANQRAGLAARGVVVDQGTADVIAADAARYSKIDQITLADNARREAFAYKMQGINERIEAKAEEKEGRQKYLAGLVGAGSSILNVAGTVAPKWLSFNSEQGSSKTIDPKPTKAGWA